MKNTKLIGKDLILTGALTALMFIIYMIISIVMSLAGPVTNVFYPPAVSVVNGIVMMLLLAKVPKYGALSIAGVIQGLLSFLVGAFWTVGTGLIVGALLADFLIIGKREITTGKMIAAYSVFSGIFTFGAIAPMNILRDAFMQTTLRNGLSQEYVDGLINMTQWPMLTVIIIAGFIGGLVGGFIGLKVLKKHFVKAGLVQAA
ncbi:MULTISPECIES: MptD family putative ECF transporter S component [Butyrivibrio]|uniref:Energy-coupling factor transport system substrate-specific component n=1 Tax=Butyrivibrio hungatei TaxID=185008 RepID=A0A1G5F6A8_9FIRM|nr:MULTISPECIES: MptD family putative ECF transporter S component [Butyrivibrio]SCY34420.1 energy-coupling factor transport system substrate-specific component [Butyrivibrio hungatei]